VARSYGSERKSEVDDLEVFGSLFEAGRITHIAVGEVTDVQAALLASKR